MDILTNAEPGKWQKWASKYLDMGIIRVPPESWVEANRDDLMAFHWCPICKEHRFDRHYDFLSQSERVECSKCGRVEKGRSFGGATFFFYLMECYRMAFYGPDPENKKQISGKRLSYLRYTVFVVFGPSEKYLPVDRGGKTISEIGVESIFTFMAVLSILPNIHKVDE